MLLSPLKTPTEEHQNERRQEREAAKQEHPLAWYRKLGGNVGFSNPDTLGGLSRLSDAMGEAGWGDRLEAAAGLSPAVGRFCL